MIQRTFIPGSQWVYIKLYAGEKTVDDILIKVIAPILKKLRNRQLIEKWFFIRYSDPDFHLRIRLLINDTYYIGEIIQLFNQKLNSWINNHLIWKVQLDTYNRELERYNSSLIEETESIFFFDSECVLSILKRMNGNENYRWMITLKLIDELLSNFCCKIDKKQDMMGKISQSFKNEFGFKNLYLKQFNVKFRENKMIIESVLNNTLNEQEFVTLYSPIKKRTVKLLPIIEQIKNKLKNNNDIDDLLRSYLHMTFDRVFLSKNRIHEMILCDFMFRYYSSKIAKEKYNK